MATAVFEIVLSALVNSFSTDELTFGGPVFDCGGPKKYALQ